MPAEDDVTAVGPGGRKLTAGERIRLARAKAANNKKSIAIGSLFQPFFHHFSSFSIIFHRFS